MSKLPRQRSKAVSDVSDPGDVGNMKDFLKETSVESVVESVPAGGLETLPSFIDEGEEWTESKMDMITGFDELPDSEKKGRRMYLQKFYEGKDENPDDYHSHNVRMSEIYDFADEYFVDESVLQDLEDLIKEKNEEIAEGIEDDDPIKDPLEIPYEYERSRAELIDPDKLNDIANNLREVYWEEIRQKDRDAGEVDEFIQSVFQLDDRDFLRNSVMLRQLIRERNEENITKRRKVEWDWD